MFTIEVEEWWEEPSRPRKFGEFLTQDEARKELERLHYKKQHVGHWELEIGERKFSAHILPIPTPLNIKDIPQAGNVPGGRQPTEREREFDRQNQIYANFQRAVDEAERYGEPTPRW